MSSLCFEQCFQPEVETDASGLPEPVNPTWNRGFLQNPKTHTCKKKARFGTKPVKPLKPNIDPKDFHKPVKPKPETFKSDTPLNL